MIMYRVGIKRLQQDATGKWVAQWFWSKPYASLNKLFAAMQQHPEAFLNKDIRIVSVK